MGVIQDTYLDDTHKGREEFSEVRMQDPAWSRSYGTRNTPQRAAAARVLPASGAVTSVTTVTTLGKGSWTYGGDTHASSPVPIV